MRVVVVGSTGVIGRRVVPELLAADHEVGALVRGGPVPAALQRADVRLLEGDLLAPETLDAAVGGADVVVNVASAIPTVARPTPGDWAVNDRVREHGTRNLVTAASAAGVAHIVHTSVYLVYGDEPDADPVDEATPLRPAPALRSAVAGEQIVRASGIPWTILRPGWLYDARAAGTSALLRQLREGEAVVLKGAPAWRSPVHAIDVARAVVAVLAHRSAGATFNIADAEPVRSADLLDGVAELIGAPAPRRITLAQAGPAAAALRRSARLSTARVREAVGFVPRFATWREGFQALLGDGA